MSEYQYYEFLSLDKPLTESDMQWLRGLSTRAQITATSFVNVYHWGNFRGDPIKLMERCFDAFVYVTNWGCRQFMLRLPCASFDVARAKLYCHRDGLVLRKKRNCILLDFGCGEEPGDWVDLEDGAGWMASLAPLRNSLLDGDWRCLYLAWLMGVESDGLPDDALEPPVPDGLSTLSAPLRAFVDFMQIDTTLIDVAAERSGDYAVNKPSTAALKKWICSLPIAVKDELLLKIAQGEESDPHRKIIHDFKKATRERHPERACNIVASRRTVTDIATAWEKRLRKVQRQLADQAKKELDRQAIAEAKARKKYLDDLSSCVDTVWDQVSVCIKKRTPKGYECAVKLLSDLRDAEALTGSGDEFRMRFLSIREQHASKPNFILRLEQAGFDC